MFVSAVPQQHTSSAQVALQPTTVYPAVRMAGLIQQSGLPTVQNDSEYQSTGTEIMAYIVANPSVYMRELSEDLGLSMGVVEYHVWSLVKDGKVEDFRNGRYRRFFGTAMYHEMEQKVTSLMRQDTPGRILSLLSEGEPLTHGSLSGTLGVTSQALTWQMGRLRAMGIIETTSPNRDNRRTSYRLNEGVSQLVSQYGRLGRASMVSGNTSHPTVNCESSTASAGRDWHPPANTRPLYRVDHFIIEPREDRAKPS